MVVVNTTTLNSALGLTENELNVFQGFTLHPGVTAAKLSSLLGMDKSSTYRSVARLVSIGLLVPTPHTKSMGYTASPPEKLIDRYNEHLDLLNQSKNEVYSFVSKLVSSSHRKTQTRIEVGLLAVQKAMLESLSCQEKLIREIYRDHSIFKDLEHRQFISRYRNIRAQRGIVIRQYLHRAPLHVFTKSEEHAYRKNFLKEVKELPNGLSDMNSIRIWDSTVNFYSEDTTGEITVVTINDQLIAEFMKKLYDFVWVHSIPA